MKIAGNFQFKLSKWIWGTLLLLAAAFIIANQFNEFVDLGLGSLIVAALAVTFFVQCLAHLSFAPLPIPLAVLYITFRGTLDWPYISPWMLIIAAVLASCGLAVLFPRKWKRVKVSGGGRHSRSFTQSGAQVEDSGGDNNPVIDVTFGAASRYIHADSLETARLICKFGSLEAFFDQAQLSPDGATVVCDCQFGSIEITVPRHWRVIDDISCALGGVNHNGRASPAEDAPQLTVTGNVSFGGIEIRYV
ncbi:MAG: hypothetical protein LBI19_01955 [Oscillospiraceae bacterium]|jgi:hypothetical protein|nr:hypothetical protein [Oscillospiraceae bacterium]